MPELRYITVESLDEGRVRRITMNRPRYHNAQHRGLLVELDEAMLAAEADDQVRVVIMAGAGDSFSSGHDMGTQERNEERAPGPGLHPTYEINSGTRQSVEKRMVQEWHYYYGNSLRWRNLRKITIAQTHGQVLAAALTLAWSCDLIVAAENTVFADPVGVRMGAMGIEYFAHPWEFGARRTKELMLTGRSVGVEEAHQIGMVSQIFPTDELADRTLEYATEIARRPTMMALLMKEAVNQTQDIQGFTNALHACFSLHQLSHSHWVELHGEPRARVEDGAVPFQARRTPAVSSADADGGSTSESRARRTI